MPRTVRSLAMTLRASTWTTVPDRHLAEAVLSLRGRALWYLNDTMTAPQPTITFRNALVAGNFTDAH